MRGFLKRSKGLAIHQVKVDVTQRNQNPAALLPEKCEPEVPNNFRERSLKKELGGETKDTEGDDDHKKKENYSAEFRHGSIPATGWER
jgi:hypothetical protein